MVALLRKSAHWTRRLRRQAQRHMLTIKNRANVTIEASTMNARDPKRVVIDRFGSLLPFGLEIEKGREYNGVGSFVKTSNMESTIIGTSTALSKRIFSMPSTTITPPRMVMTSPKASGIPVRDDII